MSNNIVPPKISKIVRIDPKSSAVTSTESVTTVGPDFSQIALEREVAAVLDSNDANAIAKVQLKLSLAMVTQLNKIDWKLWEFYNRLGK
jgi:hypothetical protein